MNELDATTHLVRCGVEIRIRDFRPPEQIARDMIARGVIPPLETLEKEGMTLPADDLEIFARRTEAMSVDKKINC